MTNNPLLKISRVKIVNFRQFKDIDIDLTYTSDPNKPLEKICFLGRNGAGKSTIINTLANFLGDLDNHNMVPGNEGDQPRALWAIKYVTDKFPFYVVYGHVKLLVLDPKVENIHDWLKALALGPSKSDIAQSIFNGLFNVDLQWGSHFYQDLKLKSKKDLVIKIPSYSNVNSYDKIDDVPKSSINSAYAREMGPVHLIDGNQAEVFWDQLIRQILNYREKLDAYRESSNNRNKVYSTILQEFESANTEFLKELATVWNLILDRAGLYFDAVSAKKPKQPNENLYAYVRLKSNGTPIQYNRLSEGIRSFIFRLGHIYSLYFEQNIERGFIFADEPENSLHPDFLFDLLDIYSKITYNSQIFIATHSPIVAAQFEPDERIILEFNDEEDTVSYRRGISPTGDNPNDILESDFTVRNIYGKKGLEAWDEYLNLVSKIKTEKDTSKKRELSKRYLKLGLDYNFPTEQR